VVLLAWLVEVLMRPLRTCMPSERLHVGLLPLVVLTESTALPRSLLFLFSYSDKLRCFALGVLISFERHATEVLRVLGSQPYGVQNIVVLEAHTSIEWTGHGLL
jgi:hypothetical protein